MTLTEQPTTVGTPCANCRKPITKSYIRENPFTDVCRGTCLMALTMKDLADRVKSGAPLFDDMQCACCCGVLKVFSKRIDPLPTEIASICDTCSFRRCPKGDQCSARRAA